MLALAILFQKGDPDTECVCRPDSLHKSNYVMHCIAEFLITNQIALRKPAIQIQLDSRAVAEKKVEMQNELMKIYY